MMSHNCRAGLLLAIGLSLALSAAAADNRTKLKPGFNMFSPQQDIELGRDASRETEKELRILNDRQAVSYIESLGRRLASYAPGERYPYQFKIVNDSSINAFALPGGFVYINRGAIEAADTEAQIAGVMAHEIGHVVLRHGTHQMSNAYLAQAPFAVLGGLIGRSSIAGVVAQLGTTTVLLHYSREAETQADLMGTQILHDSGYDPRAMVEFFEKIEAESKGRAIQFFSDHPNPDNRIGNVQREIQRLGGVPVNSRRDAAEFHTAKNRIASAPVVRKTRSSSR